MTDTHGPSTSLTTAVERLRRQVRRALLAERVAQAVAFGVLAALAGVLLDRVFRFPPMLRAAELLALLGGGAAWLVLRVWPAWRFSPPLVEVALRAERGRPDATGVLAAGVDLATGASTSETAALGRKVIDDAAAIAEPVTRGRVDTRPMRRAAAGAVVAGVAIGIACGVAPDLASIGARRLLLPFSDVQWPARTMVEAAMHGAVHPRGTALPLRAIAVRGEASSMRVEAEYRVLGGSSGGWRRILLSPQPDGSFERLVEADGNAVEVVFRTPDMETLPVTVQLLPPPSVVSATVDVQPPDYLAGVVDARTADLGDGSDQRALLSPPVLDGSTVTLELRMQGTVPPPSGDALAEWSASTFRIDGGDGRAVPFTVNVDPADTERWTLQWSAVGRGVVEVSPVGAEGIRPSDRIAFEVPAIPDTPPTVSIVDPASDDAVTPSAKPRVVAEARDDFAVTRSWIEVSVARGGQVVRTFDPVPGTDGPSARVETELDIAGMGAQPGDRVVCIARVVDAFRDAGGARAPVSSTPRVFRVIAPTELIEQVRSRLGQMRDAASRLREEQAGIAASAQRLAQELDATDRAAPGASDAERPGTTAERGRLAGAEARMAERVASFERSLGELADRLERNGIEADGLRETVAEAARTARSAAEQAQGAADRLASPEADTDQEAVEGAVERARAAESSLADLEASLGRDRESAELTRRIDRLAERIADASRQTQSAGQRSIGRTREQLDDETRTQLDRAAEMQREAAAEARALADDLDEQADRLGQDGSAEPGAAEAMREAAREAEERGLSRQLEQAAERTERNQVQGAQQAQQQAQQAVEAMQQAMRNQQRARQQELERRATRLVDALQALLGGIERRMLPVQQLDGSDADATEQEASAVLRLARDAGAVAELAAAGGAPARRVTELVARGAEQLDQSATALRDQPGRVEDGQRNLEGARTSVQQALEAAAAAQREAERAAENRRRQELRTVYEAVLERQRIARGGTESILPAPGRPTDRRTFVESRRVGTEQALVTSMLQAIAKRPDLAESDLFGAANEEMIEASGLAVADLTSGAPSRRTVLVQQEVESTVASLMEALADPPEPDDPFAQNPGRAGEEGGPGGAGGGGGQADRVPPIAELRLLRTMAQRVLDDTAAAEQLPANDREAYLSRVADRQRRILELGTRWAEAMREAAPQAVPAPEAAPAGGAEGSER